MSENIELKYFEKLTETLFNKEIFGMFRYRKTK